MSEALTIHCIKHHMLGVRGLSTSLRCSIRVALCKGEWGLDDDDYDPEQYDFEEDWE